MNMLLHKYLLKAGHTALIALAITASAHSATLNITDTPLYLSTGADPNVLVNMSVETPMGGAAYNDNTGVPSGCSGRRTISGNADIGTCYFPTTTYLGYFNPDRCYSYSSSRFVPGSPTATDHSCSSQWSGNFLNWASMTAIDMFIMNMTGGNRVTGQDTTSLTVVRRARKQNNDSWFPRKAVGSGISGSVASNTVTPFNKSTLYIYNTDWGIRVGDSLDDVVDGSGSGLLGSYAVDVQVCTSASNKENNCKAYGSYYKPEGLIQANAGTKRFGVISYTLDNTPERDGGVIRSNMKYVGPTLPNGSTNSVREFGTDGLLVNNPDGAVGVNSGVINYINKFSEPGYKSYDPVGELFYESVRYFKHLAPTPEYSSGSPPNGGFQIVTSWTDPMQYRCQKNFIVAINDANPWLDKKLPGTFFQTSTLNGASGSITLASGDYGTPSNADPSINVRNLTNQVGAMEGLNSTWSNTGTWTSTGTSGSVSGTNDSVGGGAGTWDNSCTSKAVTGLGEVMGTCPSPGKQNSYYIAGLAYYANTTDLRSDFANDRGIQNVQSFIIDTQEYNANPLDGPKNMLWLAGKYGGFTDTNSDNNPNFVDDGSGTAIASKAEWDDDGDGSPDNYVLATQPQNLVNGLNEAFAFIDRKDSSASSASVNSGSISSGTRVYQARFNSGAWTGELFSYELDTATGEIDALDWKASDHIPAANARRIVTRNSTGSPAAFQMTGINSLDATRKKQLLCDASDGSAACLDTANQTSMLNYLRGDPVNEGAGSAKFRRRPLRLGDIVSSSPLYVGRPSFRYSDSFEGAAYSTFAATHTNRSMVLAGANDGMLHVFNATSGDELFGYIPGAVFPRLRNLASQGYTHQFFVDGPPSMGDVFFGGAWHTVVAGGLNKGGQAVYALDVTSASALTEANAATVALWEFTDQNDADLGYTYSQPSIVRTKATASDKWAAVFGNGYNNTLTTTLDTTASATGNAVLYVVDIQNGSLIKKIDTGVGTAQDPTGQNRPNGLATPALVDLNGDRIVDYAYAGDLFGNMWKFDLTSQTESTWDVAYKDGAGTPLPLFTAVDSGGIAQPITVRPEVARGPGGSGMIVLFGTGKYLENSDKSLTPQLTQSFYGIVDKNTGTTATDRITARSALQPQTILAEVDPDGAGPLPKIRATSNNPVGAKRGWYMDFLSPPSSTYRAEKLVSNPIVRNGNVIFSTLIPDTTPCEYGGTSWVMEMDMLSGSRLDVSPFDLNNDGQFTTADKQTVTLEDGTTISVAVSGIGSAEGILSTPGVIDGSFVPTGNTTGGYPVQYKYAPGTSGNIQKIIEQPGEGGVGRQSWRQTR